MMTWDEMSPRERDALVAVEVMEWERGLERYPRYTTDIAAAWEVVEEVVAEGERFYRIEVEQVGTYVEIPGPDIGLDVQVSRDTAPEAICIAALRAKGVDV